MPPVGQLRLHYVIMQNMMMNISGRRVNCADCISPIPKVLLHTFLLGIFQSQNLKVPLIVSIGNKLYIFVLRYAQI